MMRVDAHHHLWSLARGDYGWIDLSSNPSLAPIARDFGLEEYSALAQKHGIEASIAVQAAPTIAETEWLLAQAARSDGLIRGVVGWVDMEAADAAEQIARLATNPLLRGVRPMLQDIADPGWMLRDWLRPAFRALVEHDLCFDLLVKSAHLEPACILLDRHPDLRAVVDHGAKPAIARGEWSTWAEGIRRIAYGTSAYCKLSGLATEAAPGAGTAELRRYADHLLECFGPRRLIWGSDWPVLTLACGYREWIRAADELLRTLDERDRWYVNAGNALGFYRLAADPVPPFHTRD